MESVGSLCVRVGVCMQQSVCLVLVVVVAVVVDVVTIIVKFLTTSFNYRDLRDEDMACREAVMVENNGSRRAGFWENKISSRCFWQSVIEVDYKTAVLCQRLFILLKAIFWKMQGFLGLYHSGLSRVDI